MLKILSDYEILILESRCKHGMIIEYCALCNRFDYIDTVKFPIPSKDHVTGEPRLDKEGKQKNVWLEQEVTRTIYKRYR